MRYRQASIATDAAACLYLLPVAANPRYPIRVYKAVSGVYVFQDPSTYLLVQDVDWGQDVTQPGMTVTGNGSNLAAVIDNNAATQWTGAYATSGQSFTIDLGTPVPITGWRLLQGYTESYRYGRTFTIYASNASGSGYVLLRSFTTQTLNTWWAIYLRNRIAYRYWQFYTTSVNTVTATAMWEVELHTTAATPAVTGIDFPSAPGAGSLIVEYVTIK
ncbi:MAG: discoidin domain-containing protein [Chloroflexales bacterium]|nr:discoidin domain-containing protein [Chloroflexales bacterium]